MPAFGIRIVDENTGQGIPMVALETLHSVVYHTDNSGYIAFYEPGLMKQKLYAQLSSAGYRYTQDQFGKQGVVLDLAGGRDTILSMTRTNLAERLCRLTGTGKYVHQRALGLKVPQASAAPKGGILGQDSNLAAKYKGKVLWIWGDSFLPQSYYGNFSVSGAWSSLPSTDSWSAKEGINYQYIVNSKGQSRPMIKLKQQGYVWFDWLMNISDERLGEQLVAKYARVDAFFGNYERGLALFDDEADTFKKYKEVSTWLPEGHECIHPFLVRQDETEPYYYLASELAMSRISSSLDAVVRPERYEQFSCLLPATKSENGEKVERDEIGQPIYKWRRNTKALNYRGESDLVEKGLLAQSEKLLHTRDVWSGEPIDVGRGSVSWNAYRKRWIMIGGKQDIWYGEADTPVGPWIYLQKVASHNQFFYNPVHHAFLDEERGSRIYFEGTFTKFFSQEPPIPRYDYNQLQYGLSLDHPDLILPVPVYVSESQREKRFSLRKGTLENSASIQEIPFFALDRKIGKDATIAVISSADGSGKLVARSENTADALFYGIKPACAYTDLWQGNWDMDIAFRSFDNSVSLALKSDDGSWYLTASKEGYQFDGLQIDGDSLSVELLHEETKYTLIGKLGPGTIKGRFGKGDELFQGKWTAMKKGGKTAEWICFSSGLVPLYEYNKNGVYHYSTQYSDGGRMICKVWENPSSVINYDFGAVPVE
ncbi:MAG: hypothetical protein HKN87_02865 [Saprospiraceae bacterium]|nr:hypothetical protein [Saprospiraceae bacterium]